MLRNCFWSLIAIFAMLGVGIAQQVSIEPQGAEKVIIDSDIGDDIDDAFALALALRSPELRLLGVTTTFGDTELRAKLADRLLGEAGRPDIPVAAGSGRKPRIP